MEIRLPQCSKGMSVHRNTHSMVHMHYIYHLDNHFLVVYCNGYINHFLSSTVYYAGIPTFVIRIWCITVKWMTTPFLVTRIPFEVLQWRHVSIMASPVTGIQTFWCFYERIRAENIFLWWRQINTHFCYHCKRSWSDFADDVFCIFFYEGPIHYK